MAPQEDSRAADESNPPFPDEQLPQEHTKQSEYQSQAASISSARHPRSESPENLESDEQKQTTQSRDKGKARASPSPTPSEHQQQEGSEPPLPDEEPPLPDGEPPLPEEAPPQATEEDDGWAPVWDSTVGAYYFFNRFTQATQWENPRVPTASSISSTAVGAPGTSISAPLPAEAPPGTAAEPVAGGYDPAIHGDYDENAWYAQSSNPTVAPIESTRPVNSLGEPDYSAVGSFNRFTGRWQAASITPDNFTDEKKSGRQMNAFFDVDAAMNSHDGRSLKEERRLKSMALSKKEIREFKIKKKQRKEEKKRAWLLD